MSDTSKETVERLAKWGELLHHDRPEFKMSRTLRALLAERDALRLALDVSMGMHAPDMPGDSRAVPDWFVACAAVQCGLADKDGKIRECLMHNAEVVKTLTPAPLPRSDFIFKVEVE